jgi:hypothetical protein
VFSRRSPELHPVDGGGVFFLNNVTTDHVIRKSPARRWPPIRVGRKVSFFTVGGTKVRYAQDRHMPEGKWVQTMLAENIVGVHHRKADATTFARAARRAEAKGLQYGVPLEHRPDNPHDANAIAVIGVAEQKGWFTRRIGHWHIGYLDRDVAAEIINDLVSKGIAVAAELYSIYEGDDGFLDFKVIVLAQPGYSTKARLRAAAAGGTTGRNPNR